MTFKGLSVVQSLRKLLRSVVVPDLYVVHEMFMFDLTY